ncbi:hypothetical protein WJX74_006434 [Apatococcus lobatus]|uniref:Phospholipid-transporting ATPase n=1 Tax=Apatococcus lobatus TaxID=904363 RepID=A0AAW1RZ16_9CHLO
MKQSSFPSYAASPNGGGTIAASLESESSALITEAVPVGSGQYDDIDLRAIGNMQTQKVKHKCVASEGVCSKHGDDLLPEQDESSRRIWMRLDGPVPYKARRGRFQRWMVAMGLAKARGPTNNRIRTSKYTPLTFLPANLLQQFMRAANLYFLAVVLMQTIPGLSPTPWQATALPLVFVLTVNAIKEAGEEISRHSSDDQINGKLATLLRGGEEVLACWAHLQVGDVVKVRRDEDLPADLICLASSDDGDLCHVETANLDGETNLKLKYAHPGTAKYKSAGDLRRWAADWTFQTELPNERLYEFEGAVMKDADRTDPLDIANLLLRGCTLCNTDWILGLIVFAGHDTKIFRNRTKAPRKVTQLERTMNLLVALVFAVQVIWSVLASIGNYVFLTSHEPQHWYLRSTGQWPELKPGLAALFVQFLRFMILFNQLIPISLYITLELVKVCQCKFLQWDCQLYHAESDSPCVARTSTLNEELGQVQYVLTDKTGTLTQNVMGFVLASIQGRMYGRQLERLPVKASPHSLAYDMGLKQSLQQAEGNHAADAAKAFLTHLAVCNTVTPTHNADGELIYQASSPDEEALVQGAAQLGFRLRSRSLQSVEIDCQGLPLELEVLAVLDFTSDRKRMSVLCRLPDGQIRLFCKGADNVIYSRLAPGQPLDQYTQPHLAEMSRSGFRTLCIAQRDLHPESYEAWAREYHAASIALHDREAKMEAAAHKIEAQLELLGATAVEDRLQTGVPKAVHTLLQAGIRVWVLTGDKIETAISISLACQLFSSTTKLLMLREHDLGSADSQLTSEVLKLKAAEVQRLLSTASHPSSRAVVCCRVSPRQKSLVTSLVKRRAGTCLGIGDGANDVGMIQAAHIGVGISGREGRAAVLASDFHFGQFRFLPRLLLIHGRWAMKRNLEVVMYMFYKNLAYNLPNFLFAIISGCSSLPFYSTILIASYNVMWSSMPIIGFAVFEQDLRPISVEQNPQLYGETASIQQQDIILKFCHWMIEACWHGLTAFAIPLLALGKSGGDGKAEGVDLTGLATFTCIILIVNLKVLTRASSIHSCHCLLVFGTILGFFYFLRIVSARADRAEHTANLIGVVGRMLMMPRFWLSAAVVLCVAFFPSSVATVFRNHLQPPDHQLFKELELTLPPFALLPTSEPALVPMVSLPNGKVQMVSSDQEHGPERFQMVSE